MHRARAAIGVLPFYLFTLLLLTSCGVDSDKFRLEGRLRNMHQGEFWVYTTDGTINGIDTIPVREGRFIFETPLRSSATLIIVFPNYSELPVFAKPGAEVDIKGDATHLREISISGTDENDDMTQLRQQLNKLMPPDVPKKVEEYIKDNPASEVSIYLLQRYFLSDANPDYKKALALVNLMAKEQPDNGQIIKWQKQLPLLGNGALKSKLQAFTAKDVKGASVTEGELKRKVNVLSVWATWNFQSTDMQRRLFRLKKEYADKLGVVSICLDARPQDIKTRVERDSLPWKTICDGQMWETPMLRKVGVSDVPGNLVIDASGTIVARNLTPQKLEEKLKEMLK